MNARICYRFLAATVSAVLTIPSPGGIHTQPTRRPGESPLSQPAHAKLSRDYGNLPLAFEPNVGQTDARVRFLARGGGMTAFFTDTETAIVLSRSRHANQPAGLGREEAPAGQVEQTVVRMKLENASRPRRAVGLEKLPGISNYFIGNDAAKWHTNVPQYARVQYEGVYPGIDLVYYGNQGKLEYDFVVGPGGDPGQIEVAFQGAEKVRIDSTGDLLLKTALGEIRWQRPTVYQDEDGIRRPVEAAYILRGERRVAFAVGEHDQSAPLVIDPVLLYATYFGGSYADDANDLAVSVAGNLFFVGHTWSNDFPVVNPVEPAPAEPPAQPVIVVSKLNNSAT